jgi:HlyD family secretion protein
MAAETSSRRRSRKNRLPIIAGVVVLVLVILGVVFWQFQNNAAQVPAGLPPGWEEVAAERGTIDSTVSATGNIEPLAEAELSFEQNGTVTAILVEPGDAVDAGHALARIDAGDLELQLEQRRAELAEAEASLADLLDGASSEEIAEAEARVAQARSQLSAEASRVTNADIAAARAELESAQARLARLESGPANNDVAAAQERLQRAQSSLEQSRTDLAAAKERARKDIETQANAVRNAQDEYSRIYWENREQEESLRKFGRELPQDAKNREEQALRSVQDAEAALDQARVEYEQAKENEVTTLRTREAELASARAEYEDVLAGAEPDDIADARAAVERARASLAELTGANRASNIENQRQSVAIAESALQQLMADPSSSALAQAEAAVVRAEVALQQAENNLQKAVLTAPFPATIARVDMQVGEQAGSNAIIAIVDLSEFHVDVPVDELDVAQVTTGQPVRIALDALPDRELQGTVTNIEPLATRNEQGTTSYDVTVTLDEAEAAVRPGMTAVVQIVTAEKTDALLVPRRAVQLEGGQSYVLIHQPGQPMQPGSNEPPSERRDVVLGLANSESIEIVEGLEEGEEVLVRDVVNTFNPAGN